MGTKLAVYLKDKREIIGLLEILTEFIPLGTLTVDNNTYHN